MNHTLHTRILGGMLAASTLAGTALAQGTACWDYDYGTRQASFNDQTTPPITLPFAFPLPGGAGSTTQVRASTNGFLWLDGTSTNTDSTPTIAELLTEPPRICAGWADLDCDPNDDQANGVFVNTSSPTRAIITWIGNDVLAFGDTRTDVVEVQVQLLPNGSFIIGHRRVDQYTGTNTTNRHDMIVGVSAGYNAADPGEANFTAGQVPLSPTSTIYEKFDNPLAAGGDPRDIATISSLLFIPSGGGNYSVTNLSCGSFAESSARGAGCPPDNGSLGYLFEYFSAGPDLAGKSVRFLRQANGSYQASLTPTLEWENGYTNRIDTDPWLWTQFSGVNNMSVPKPLGFTASYWDNDPTSDLYICSNGRIYLGPSSHTAGSPSASGLISSAAVLCLYSTSLDCTSANIPTGGGLYLDRFPASGPTPARCVVTFDQIPRYATTPPSGETLTAQAQFFANGDVILSMASCTITRSGITGFFRGGQSGTVSNTTDSVDFSTALAPPGVLAQAPLRPMLHDADLFILGETPTARTTIPFGALATILHVGVDQTSLPLDTIGMAGCTAYTLAITGSPPMAQNGTSASFTFPAIPLVQSLAGLVVSTQAFSVVPGINPLQIVASNGWDSSLGR